MGYRWACCIAAVLVLSLRCLSAPAAPLAPTADELSRASFVLQAPPALSLSATEWLFSDVRVLGTFGGGRALPRHIVGWWTVEPPDARTWQFAPDFPPAPKNETLLRAGRTVVLLADQDFHLLAVYPVGPDQYLGGLGMEQFEERVWDARRVRQIAEDFVKALATGNWEDARACLAKSLRDELDSKESPKAYFEGKGLLQVAAVHPAITVASLESDSAEVWLTDGRAVAVPLPKYVLRFTPTGRPGKGPMRGWEIASIGDAAVR